MEAIYNKFLNSCITGFCLHPKKKYLATTHGDTSINIYDTANEKPGTLIKTLSKHRGRISGIDWAEGTTKSEGISFLLSSGEDCLVIVWYIEEISLSKLGEIIPLLNVLPPNCIPTSCSFRPLYNSNCFSVATASGDIFFFYKNKTNFCNSDMSRKAIIMRSHTYVQQKIALTDLPILCSSWNLNGSMIGCGTMDSKAIVLKLGNSINNDNYLLSHDQIEVVLSIEEQSSILSCDFSPDNELVAFTGRDCIIHILNLKKQSSLENIELKWFGLPFHNIKFARNDLIVAVGHDCIPILIEKSTKSKWIFIMSASKENIPLYLQPEWQGINDPTELFILNTIHKKPITGIQIIDSKKIACTSLDGIYSQWKIN
ncbi:hypothetical protein ACR3K2_35620 [Cryptosporidium serpentis]